MTSSTKVIERGIEMGREMGVERRGEVEGRGEAGSEETTTEAAVLVVRMPLLCLSHTAVGPIVMLVFGPLCVSERSWLCKGRIWGPHACLADISTLHCISGWALE